MRWTHSFHPTTLREYDIRGTVGRTLSEVDAFAVGRAFGFPPTPVAFVECEVRSTVEAGDHTVFVGEVVNAVFQKDEDTGVLRMEDTRMNYGG